MIKHFYFYRKHKSSNYKINFKYCLYKNFRNVHFKNEIRAFSFRL